MKLNSFSEWIKIYENNSRSEEDSKILSTWLESLSHNADDIKGFIDNVWDDYFGFDYAHPGDIDPEWLSDYLHLFDESTSEEVEKFIEDSESFGEDETYYEFVSKILPKWNTVTRKLEGEMDDELFNLIEITGGQSEDEPDVNDIESDYQEANTFRLGLDRGLLNDDGTLKHDVRIKDVIHGISAGDMRSDSLIKALEFMFKHHPDFDNFAHKYRGVIKGLKYGL